MNTLFLGIIAGVFVVLLAFMIPAIIQIRKTAKSAEDFFKDTEQSLNPILTELKTSIEKINKVTDGLEDSVSNVRHLARSIGEMGAIVDELNHLVRQTGVLFSLKTASLGVGIKTALNVLAKGLIKKGEREKEV